MEASLTDDVGLLEWVFCVESALSVRAVRPLALVFLGTVALEITAQQIEEVLRSVPVIQAELVWSSSPWALGSLRALQRATLIHPDIDPSILLANGTIFAQKFGYKPSSVVPTCAPDGQEVASEVPKPSAS